MTPPLTTPLSPAPAGYPHLVLTLSWSGSKQILSKTGPWSQSPVSPKRLKRTGLAAAPRDTLGDIMMCGWSSGCRVRGAQGHPGQRAVAAVTVPDPSVFLTEPCTGFCGDAPLPSPPLLHSTWVMYRGAPLHQPCPQGPKLGPARLHMETWVSQVLTVVMSMCAHVSSWLPTHTLSHTLAHPGPLPTT